MIMKFNLENVKKMRTSLIDCSQINEKQKADTQRIFAFQQKMRSLNFAVITIKSDAAFVISKLAQYLHNSFLNHMIAADRVIFYLYSIKNLTIEYFEIRIFEIFLCASDAVFADDEAIRKSSNDYLFQLYEEFID